MRVIKESARLISAFILPWLASGHLVLAGQSPSASTDVLISKAGEKFVGQVISATGSSVVFKSDAAGQVTVDWAKIQELHSSAKFAVIPQDVKLRGAEDAQTVPQGTISASGQELQVTPAATAAPRTLPITNAAHIVGEEAFQRAFRKRNFFQGWNGGASAG